MCFVFEASQFRGVDLWLWSPLAACEAVRRNLSLPIVHSTCISQDKRGYAAVTN